MVWVPNGSLCITLIPPQSVPCHGASELPGNDAVTGLLVYVWPEESVAVTVKSISQPGCIPLIDCVLAVADAETGSKFCRPMVEMILIVTLTIFPAGGVQETLQSLLS